MLPGGAYQADDVIQYRIGHVHRIGLGPEGVQAVQVQHLLHALQRIAALFAADHIGLVRGSGVADGQAHHEPVQLGVGQQLSARGAGGVLCGDDQKGLGHRVRRSVHRDLALLHGLQQGGLGAAGGPVELVRQKEIAQHRPRLILHFA